jgi:hypothetical protein
MTYVLAAEDSGQYNYLSKRMVQECCVNAEASLCAA